ncbi:MAG: ferrochelatase [Gammaproteobacteria bacterium]
MSRFLGTDDYRHGAPRQTGVLVVNLGTPDAPTPKALRRYLAEFLWDPRVVEMPRPLWWLVLHGAILNLRPRRVAPLYQNVWMDDGSPLLVFSKRQVQALDDFLRDKTQGSLEVELAMRYGNPSVKSGLARLRDAGVQRLLVLPMYPQYSASTTASVFDAVTSELQAWRRLPELRFINNYPDDENYIKAMAARIRDHWKQHERAELLMFSFHGIPKRYFLNGDPYHCECQLSARLLATELELNDSQWRVCFQSRFGREEWLKPYTDQTLAALPGEGIHSVDVFCPGFAADCLETLEEIAIQNREVFIAAGGREYNYIPALNDMAEHIAALGALVLRHLQGWPQTGRSEQDLAASRERAVSMGARR